MKVRRPLWILMAAGAAVWFPLRAAHAGFQYQSNIVEDDVNPSTVHLPGCNPSGTLVSNQTVNVLTCAPSAKVVIKPSTKKGDGGSTVQLVLKKVTCGGSPCTASNHVLELGARAVGNDIPGSLPGIVAAAGIPYNLASGTAAFVGSGKNSIGLGKSFGILASQVFTRSLGIGLIKLHTTAGNVADCATAPISAANAHCIDGDVYAVAGFPVPLDPTFTCSSDAQCILSSVCTIPPGICSSESCAEDADCRPGAACNINAGTCCIPGQTCP